MELENNEEGKGKGNKKHIAIIAVVVATQHPPSSQPVSSPAVQPQWQQTLPMLSH